MRRGSPLRLRRGFVPDLFPVMLDDASGSGASDGVMAGHMTRDTADCSALEAPSSAAKFRQ